MQSLHPVISYVDHLVNAKSKHGVHSPFVYRLVTEVLSGKANTPACSDVEALRERLLQDRSEITITDLGAGSRTGANTRRKVSSIARAALHSRKDCSMLYRLAQDMNASTILELGTSLGISTSYLAKACPQAQVITIEGCPRIHSIAKSNFSALGIENIRPLNGAFSDVLPAALEECGKIDLLYIDGDHRSGPTLNNFELCLPYLHDNSLVIFDDIHWSSDMEDAWLKLKAHQQVTVSIDTFQFGLVFLRKGQAEQHFKVRV